MAKLSHVFAHAAQTHEELKTTSPRTDQPRSRFEWETSGHEADNELHVEMSQCFVSELLAEAASMAGLGIAGAGDL